MTATNSIMTAVSRPLKKSGLVFMGFQFRIERYYNVG